VSSLEEIVPGLYGLTIRGAGLPYVNAYVVRGPDGVVIVDTGLPRRVASFARAVSALGRTREDVRAIVLTHHHIDHTGSVHPMATATGASVLVHPADRAVIMGDAPPPAANRDTAVRRVLAPLFDRFQPRRVPPAAVRTVEHGAVIGDAGVDLEVVHTPGHTPGHISLHIPAWRALIAGDAAANVAGRLAPPVGIFTEDRREMRASIERLAGIEFDVACFGHGRPLKGGATARFRRLVDRLAAAG
jgi:glyoxylase-like metal-dependent hydrolase (beta-lactamase superfamily II)